MDSWGSGRHQKTWPQAYVFEVISVIFKLACIPHVHSLIITVSILKHCFVLRSSCEVGTEKTSCLFWGFQHHWACIPLPPSPCTSLSSPKRLHPNAMQGTSTP